MTILEEFVKAIILMISAYSRIRAADCLIGGNIRRKLKMRNVVPTKRFTLLTAGVLALGMSLTVSSDRVAAVQPQPDCGPNFSWACVVPGCLSCEVVHFDGTVCEKNAYQKQTGRVCTRE